MPRLTKLQRITRTIHEQVLFMASCGGTEAGYINNYGAPGTYKQVDWQGKTMTVPAWSGNGGAAIYAADKARLDELYIDFRRLTRWSR